MSLSIPLTGLASNDPVPGNYIEVNFAQGLASSGATDYPIMLIGNALSTGAAMSDGYIYGPDTTVPLTSETDAIALFGQGSELHRMFKRAIKVNQSTAIYAIAVLESVGAQATGTITVTGTATASATCRVIIGGEPVDASIVTGDTPTVIAASIAAAVNSKPDWAVTASSTAGVVTITAKQKGPRGNFLRFSARLLNACGVSVTPSGLSNALTGGTTADSNTNALATLSAQRFYQLVSAAEDATQVGALAAQVDTMAAPLVGLRLHGYAR
jgi:phage tail sheath gpL-like